MEPFGSPLISKIYPLVRAWFTLKSMGIPVEFEFGPDKSTYSKTPFVLMHFWINAAFNWCAACVGAGFNLLTTAY